MYSCENCNFTTNDKSKYNRHINTKKHKKKDYISCIFCDKKFFSENKENYIKQHLKICKEKNSNIVLYEKELGITLNKTDKYQCRFCFSKYKHQSSYSRHMISCKEKINYEKELELKVKNNRQQVINITNNTTNNTTINNFILPQLRPFGQENEDYLTTKVLLKELELLKSNSDITPEKISNIITKFTKLLHANPAHPENHNVSFESLNSPFANVFTGVGFEKKQSFEVQDEILRKAGRIIGTQVADQYNNNNENITNLLDNLEINIHDRIEEIETDDNTRSLSRCRNAVKAVLNSNKKEIETSQKILDSIIR